MKFQAIVLASFLVMPYALADDQGGLKQDAAPPPPHAIDCLLYTSDAADE